MSAKNKDHNGRWRCKTVAFRMSEEENRELDQLVALSGLTKQDYIIARLLNKEVVVMGNPRVFKALKRSLEKVHEDLKSLIENREVIDDETIETIMNVSRIMNGMGKEDD